MTLHHQSSMRSSIASSSSSSSLLFSSSPPQNGSTPRKASAKSGASNDITLLHLSITHSFVECQWNRCCTGIAVLTQIGNHFVHGHTQPLCHCFHDSNIGLMKQ
mmetsp:Transcript_10673/g.17970  ORF Transcript_10673/g.17970 Transcript_10673/m.17970 type:complete len:104 (+) Transcript_10673:70-381(+)